MERGACMGGVSRSGVWNQGRAPASFWVAMARTPGRWRLFAGRFRGVLISGSFMFHCDDFGCVREANAGLCPSLTTIVQEQSNGSHGKRDSGCHPEIISTRNDGVLPLPRKRLKVAPDLAETPLREGPV